MQKPDHVFLVCCSFRKGGESQGKCAKKGSAGLLGVLEEELSDRGMDNVVIASTGCLNMCANGPVMAVYPEGHWYGGVDESTLEEILDAVEEGGVAESHLLTAAGQ